MTDRARRGGAVLGSPIAHSLSPVLHRAAYAALGLEGWHYRAVECDRASLAVTLPSLAAEGLAGVSLTMPLKRAVLPLLAAIEPVVAAVGGANTVLFDDAGWRGANTDVAGMVAALRGAGIERLAAPPVVLGAGATAAAALAALADLGATAAVVVARRPHRAAALRPTAVGLGVDLEIRPWTAPREWSQADLVVATTPAGATDRLAGSVGSVGSAAGVLFDVVYAPWPTVLAAAWSAAGGTVVGGLELLVEQAAGQVRLMTGQAPPVEAMRRAVVGGGSAGDPTLGSTGGR